MTVRRLRYLRLYRLVTEHEIECRQMHATIATPRLRYLLRCGDPVEKASRDYDAAIQEARDRLAHLERRLGRLWPLLEACEP